MAMERKGMKTLLFSVMALCISTALIVGGTYALFTDSAKVNTHLEAGNLKIGLERIHYTEHVLDLDTGLMTDNSDDTPLDLKTNPEPLFELTNAVPTSSYVSVIEITNQGSTAFDYGIRFNWTPQSDNAEIFAEQIDITLSADAIVDDTLPEGVEIVTDADTGEQSITMTLQQWAGMEIDINSMLKGGSNTFTITVVFVDKNTGNNDAMLADLTFDFTVYATQKVA